MKVFFSQPMRGEKDEDIKQRMNDFRDTCVKSGLEVLESYITDNRIKSLQACRKFSYKLLMDADIMVYSPFNSSLHPTCQKEQELAVECGIPIFKLSTFVELGSKIKTVL